MKREDLINGELLYRFAAWLLSKRDLSPSTVKAYVSMVANLYSTKQLEYGPRKSAVSAYVEFLRSHGINITYDEFVRIVCTGQPPEVIPRTKVVVKKEEKPAAKPTERLKEIVEEAFKQVEEEEKARAPIPSLRDLARFYNRLKGLARAVIDIEATVTVYLSERQVRLFEILEKAEIPLPQREGNVLILTPKKAAEIVAIGFDEAFKRIARVHYDLTTQ